MSANELTTAYGRFSPVRDSGRLFTEIQLGSPSGWSTPIKKSEQARPVLRLSIAGCWSAGSGAPSSRIARRRGSATVRPVVSSRLRPSIRSAAGL
jgi:hypothetical protein